MLLQVDPHTNDGLNSPENARVTAGTQGRAVVGKKSVSVESHIKDPVWAAHVARIRDHQDQSAFVELFQHFAPRIKAFLMKSGEDAATAEECAQDVMATLWRKAHMFDETRATVATWVFTIARNRRIDILRKARRPEPEELTWGPEPEPDQVDALATQQDNEQLREAVKELPDEQRELIELAYFAELTHAKIATKTGLPLGTVKSRIRLALERLRHAMR